MRGGWRKDEKQLHVQDQLSNIFIRTGAPGPTAFVFYQTSLKGYRRVGERTVINPHEV